MVGRSLTFEELGDGGGVGRDALARNNGRSVRWTSCFEAGIPWEKSIVGSLHWRFRGEILMCAEVASLFEATSVIDGWRKVYNQRRPHSSLGGVTPAQFASQCTASVRPPASLQQYTVEEILT